MFKWVVLFLNSKWCAPKLFKRPKGESQNEITKEEKSWGTFFDSQHFEDKKNVLELWDRTKMNS